MHHRPALIVLALVAAAECLALGWWQWTRFESVGGTAQNLGYALQWPLFAGFVIYAYRRFVQLERDGGVQEVPHSEPTEIPTDLLPPRPAAAVYEPDPVMDEYNRYLAELNRDSTDRRTP